MNLWELPQTAVIGGKEYEIKTDYRQIFEIFEYLNDPDHPEWLRWQIAIGLFFEDEIPEEYQYEAGQYLAAFIACGDEGSTPGPKLLDWEQDAQIIAADVNKVSGMEIRALPYLHWWTFLSYFRAIGEGQLSAIVSIRDKLRTGKKLESWERDYYLKNPERVDLKSPYYAEEQAELSEIEKLLGG